MKLKLVILTALSLILGNLHANPSKTAALSENLVIYQVQTGGAIAGTAREEVVIVYNNSDDDIDITGWCLQYSSASDNVGFENCVETNDLKIQLWLQAKGYASFATSEFELANPGFVADFLLSGGMSGSSGHLRLFDANPIKPQEIDKVGWGSAINPETLAVAVHLAGDVLSRNLSAVSLDTDNNNSDFSSAPIINNLTSGIYEVEIEIDVCENIDGLQIEPPVGYLQDENANCYEDFCPNLDGLQIVAPKGYEKPAGLEVCEEIPLENRVIYITELLPNPPSYDTDDEFIELYNPHNEAISLSGYKIQVGPSFTKEFEFSGGVILPGEYLVFNDGITGITLPNTNGVKLRLVAPAGNVVSETEVYSNAGDDVSWALVNDQWIYTNQITPDNPNKPYIENVVLDVEGTTTIYAPCPAGKFRNPETNRCKNIETAVSQLKPCEPDEYRNPETNRCRKIVLASTALKPCPEGQERNPETNRCRKVSVLGVSTEDEIPTVTDVSAEQTAGSINWPIIALALMGTTAYMIYEWRLELGRAWVKIK